MRATRRKLAEARRRENRSAHLEGARPGARLVFEPLQQLILLNADTMTVQLASLPNAVPAHDIIVQMVNDLVVVGPQTQMVQRVRVIDNSNHGAVLAVGDLSAIQAVAISATAGADTITLDLASFAGATAPSLQVSGDGLTALAVSHGPTLLAWQVNGDGSGDAAGAGASVSFTGVDAIAGNGAADVLTGPSATTNWAITAPGAGSVAIAGGGLTTAFSGIAQLDGAPDSVNTFSLYPGGSLSQGVVGGAGGYNTLAYIGGQYGNITALATGPNSGSVTADGVTTVYAGLQPLLLPSSATVTISLTTVNGDMTLTDDPVHPGQLTLSDPGKFESQSFVAPSGSLTIDLGSGGGNSLTLSGIDSRLKAALTVQTEGNGDTVDIDTSLTLPGQSVAITADTIALGSGDTINTELAGGNAGDISLTGKSLTLNTGAQLLAVAAPGLTAGSITLSVDDTAYEVLPIPDAFVARAVSINLDGATIDGGAVAITANAADQSAIDELPVYAQGFTSSLSSLFAQIPGDILSAATGLDASVTMRGANASVLLQGTTIDSSAAVSITSTTDVEATDQAMAVGLSGLASVTGVEVSIGFAMAQSTVQTELTDATSITAAQDITVSSTGATSASTNAQASANLVGSSNDKAVQIAVAITDSQLTSLASVDNSVTIKSTGGNVNVSATGTTGSSPSTTTTGYNGGKAGINVALGFDDANVTAALNGHVSAAGSVSSQSNGGINNGPIIFNDGSNIAVDLTDSTLYLPDHGLTTGQEITYIAQSVINPGQSNSSASPATPIGGLTSGQTYYVLVVDPNHIQLSQAPPIALDPSVTNSQSTQTLSIPDAVDFELNGITSGGTIYLPGDGFSNGDTLTYNVVSGGPLSGLVSGQQYVVQTIDGNDFQLMHPGGLGAIDLAQGNATGTYSFIDNGNTQTLTLAEVDTTDNAIILAGNGFTKNQTVVYQSLSSVEIGTLDDGFQYLVSPLSSDKFQLLDPTQNDAVATLTLPDGPTVHELAYAGEAISFSPSIAVNATTDEITLPNYGFTTGQPLVYETDPNLTETQVPQMQEALTFTIGAIANNTITLPLDNFSNGDLITYTQGTLATPIAGLTSGHQYQVKVIDANDFQLLDPLSGTIETLSPGNATGTYTFTDSGNAQMLTLAQIVSANTITTAGNPLSNGESVGFQAISGTTIGALISGQNYIVSVTNAVTGAFQLLDPSNGDAVVQLSAPTGPLLYSLSYAAAAPAGVMATTSDTPIGGLQNNQIYYAVVVDATHIRLASNLANALGAVPITFTSLGAGNASEISLAATTVGIGNAASLTSSDESSAYPTTGQDANASRNLNIGTSSDVLIEKLLGGASAIYQGFAGAKDENGNNLDEGVSNEAGLTGAGAVVVNVVNHNVSALIGNLATSSTPTILSTPANLSNTSAITESYQTIAQASATKPETEAGEPEAPGSALALGLSVGIYTNASQAVIEANTVADAGATLTDTSDVNYPSLVDPSQVALGIPAAFVSNGIGELSNLLDGTFGFGTAILNTWVVSQALSNGEGVLALSGAIAVNSFNNTSLAQVEGGAQINQTTALQNVNQSVVVSATTEMTMIDLAGIGNLGLNAGGAAYFRDAVNKQGWADALTGGSLFDVFGRSEGQSVGGSLLINVLFNDTQAQIGDGSAIYVGNAGSLSLNAADTILRVDIAQAGGLASSEDSTLAFAGSGLGFYDNRRARSRWRRKMMPALSPSAAVPHSPPAVWASGPPSAITKSTRRPPRACSGRINAPRSTLAA